MNIAPKSPQTEPQKLFGNVESTRTLCALYLSAKEPSRGAPKKPEIGDRAESTPITE